MYEFHIQKGKQENNRVFLWVLNVEQLSGILFAENKKRIKFSFSKTIVKNYTDLISGNWSKYE